MRAREKRLTDYGIPEDEQKQLYEQCRRLSDAEYAVLRETAFAICPKGIAEDIILSLTTRTSYDALCDTKYMPICANDFYAYRRKTLARYYFTIKGEKL